MIDYILATDAHLDDLNTCDGTFAIERRLDMAITDGAIVLTGKPVPRREKTYPRDDGSLARIHATDAAVHLAYVDHRVAGQIDLSATWNNFAVIHQLVVDRPHRRTGIGKGLVQCAKDWAVSRGLAGVMAETQDTNASACAFYQACGFTLGGYDRFLYSGMTEVSDEIAVSWYWFRAKPR